MKLKMFQCQSGRGEGIKAGRRYYSAVAGRGFREKRWALNDRKSSFICSCERGCVVGTFIEMGGFPLMTINPLSLVL